MGKTRTLDEIVRPYVPDGPLLIDEVDERLRAVAKEMARACRDIVLGAGYAVDAARWISEMAEIE